MQRAFAIGHAAAFVAFLIGLFVRFVLRWRLLIICHWVIPGGAGFHPGGDAGAAAAWVDYANADLPHVMPMTFLSGVAMSAGMICAVFGLLGTADRTCFLDKCCIHQTDLKLKLQGIARLDEFIFHSSEMLVLYDSDYFERLWCTCEIAAYIHGAKKSNGPRLARLEPMLTVRPSSAFVTGKEKLTERRLTFLPIDIGVFAVRVCVIVAVGTFAFCLLQRALTLPALAGLIDLTNPAQYLLFYAVMANPVYWVPKMMTCYRFAVKRELLLEQLANFDCRTSKVHSESDRALVEEKIVKWFGSLDAFNREFHGEQGSLMQAVETALPNNAIAYLAILFENSPAFGYFFYHILLCAGDRYTVLLAISMGFSEHFVWNPFFISVLQKGANAGIKIQKWLGSAGTLHPVSFAWLALCTVIAGNWFPVMLWVLFSQSFKVSTLATVVVVILTHGAAREVAASVAARHARVCLM